MKKNLIIAFLCIALVMVSAYAFIPHKNPSVKANVYCLVESPEGLDYIPIGNTITDILERDARNIIGFANGSSTAYKYISLGNSSISKTKTILDTEATTSGFIRHIGTCIAWLNGEDWAYNCTYKFTSTGNINVNAVGLHNVVTSESDNNMGALASLGGAQAFEANWNCTIIWILTFNFNT